MKQARGAARSLYGRNRELTLLRVTLAAALDGGGSIVLLGGEPGIGKTRLAKELARLAEARRAIVAWGSGVDDAAPPYWPWVQVLRACIRASEIDPSSTSNLDGADLEDLLAGPRPQAPDRLGPLALAEAAPRPVSPAESRQLRLRLFASFFTRLQESAGSRPLVIVLDDLQWADTSSLLLLEFVANQLHGNRLLILGLYRDSELVPRTPLSRGLARLSRLGTVIRLTGLTADESIRLASDVTGSPVSERVAQLVHERSRGNPLFIREVVRLLESQGRLKSLTQRGASSLSMLPSTIAEAIHERAPHLSQTSRVLGEAAVIGEEFGGDLLAEATGMTEAELVELLGAAARLEFIQAPEDAEGHYLFAHSLIRETFYADLPASRRAALHRRVAEAIEDRSDKPESQSSALAHHFDLASTADTREKALHYARQAGRRALQLLAYEEAAEHFALALDLLDQLGAEESQQLELLLALGDAYLSAGHRREAVEAYDRAVTWARHLGQAEELARAALGLSGWGGFEVRPVDERHIDLLEEARAALGEEDSALRAWVMARLSLATVGRRSPEHRADLSRTAAEMARQVGDARALADSLGSYCHAISGPANTEERLTYATEMVRIGEETGDAEIELLGRRFRVPGLLEMADLRAVDEEVEAFARIAEALQPPMYLWYVPLWRGMRALMEGRLADSERFVAEARALGRQADSADADLLADAQQLGWLIESGYDHQARELLARLLNDSWDGPNAELFMLPLLARSGRTAEAHATLSRLSGEDFSRLQVEDTTWLLAMCMLAWGCVEVGDREVGAKAYDLLLPYEQRFALSGPGAVTVGSVSRYLGLLAHSLGRFEEAHAHFGRALETHRRVGASLLVAHTLRQHAAMLLERSDRGDRNRSEGLLREAISIYSELGLSHWAKAARELPGVEPEQAVEADGANVFRRDGDVWLLRFDGEEARVKDTRGLRAIARLLASPGRDFHVLDLVNDIVPAAGTGADLNGGNEQGHAGAMSDERARAEYRQRLAVLEKEIDEALIDDDPERASRAQVERRAILAQLTASYGIAGQPRRGGDPVERAQSTMAWRIGSALGRIERAHPALASHLRHSIRIGMFCSYSPDWATSWTVE